MAASRSRLISSLCCSFSWQTHTHTHTHTH